jgi:shikimate dehydrogenase
MTSSPITGRTRILGLIADPVVQARTPGMANALLDVRHLFGDFVLVPMHVSAQGFPEFLGALRHLQNFAGAVVSMPHKVAAAQIVDELTPEAKLVGAINVIRRNGDGRLTGTILDGEGFVAGLEGVGHPVSGTRCLLAGAGGAASAIAFALARHGCASLCIVNRTSSKADALASRVRQAFPATVVTTNPSSTASFDIAINGTSLGMNAGDELPFPLWLIECTSLVAECVVAPQMTRLLELTASLGREIHTGVPMLSAQMNMMLDFMGVA